MRMGERICKIDWRAKDCEPGHCDIQTPSEARRPQVFSQGWASLPRELWVVCFLRAVNSTASHKRIGIDPESEGARK